MNKRGETLLEVLIALTLVTVSAAAAASAIMSATKGLSLSKNYLIAQNLASEALEVVKNIRDTNWMLFPIDKDTCWLNKNPAAAIATECDPVEYSVGEDNDYSITLNLEKKWILNDEEAITIDSASPPPDLYALQLDSTSHKYGLPTISPNGTAIFYRGIRILGADDPTKSITIQAIVKWYEGASLQTLTGTEILTNYL